MKTICLTDVRGLTAELKKFWSCNPYRTREESGRPDRNTSLHWLILFGQIIYSLICLFLELNMKKLHVTIDNANDPKPNFLKPTLLRKPTLSISIQDENVR